MALQSEVSPPIVGDPNKDTQIDGDTKSDENDSGESTDDEIDLEEGEILDSAEEEEEEKDFTNSSMKDSLDISCLQSIEQLVNQAKNAKRVESPERPKGVSPRKATKTAANFRDHDRTAENTSDQEDGWYRKSKPKPETTKSRDYRRELEEYGGTPPSSPDRKRRDKVKKKKSTKKTKKPKKTIMRRDAKGMRVAKYKKDGARGRICKFFKEGKCAKGADCLFSHASPMSYKKRELCKFYLNGHCNKGRECHFMHNEFPCKFYHTGSDCYAKDDCRFSHAPLNEEMKKVLADYLRMTHGDDLRQPRGDDRDREERGRERDRERERKRRHSPTPEPEAPPPKRVALLGSPPRHIREAEDTRRWREEMMKLQLDIHPAFEIHLSPRRRDASPPRIAKPNFYQDTLLNTPSPNRRMHNSDNMNAYGSNSPEYGSPSKVYVFDDDEVIEIEVPPPPVTKQEPPDHYQWDNAPPAPPVIKQESPDHYQWDNAPPPVAKQEPPPESYRWSNVPPAMVKQEPPEQYRWDAGGHNENHHERNHLKHYEEDSQPDFTSDIKFDETTQFSEMENSTDGPPAVSPDSATRRLTPDGDDSYPIEGSRSAEERSSDVDVEPPPPSIVVPSHLPRRQQELFKRVLQHQRKNTGSDTEDGPAKKEPADDEREQQARAVAKEDSKWYSSEEEDDDADVPLTDVLKKIQQAPPKPIVQESKPTSQVNLLDMFKRIQQKTIEKGGPEAKSQKNQGTFWDNLFGSVNAAPSEPKLQTLLPDTASTTTPVNPTVPKAAESAPKDPRLKNRDPRKLPTVPRPTTDLNSSSNASIKVSNQTSEPPKDSVPYRLRGISSKPLNYSPYISATQSNPHLLKDPRLRRHLGASEPVNGTGKEPDLKPVAAAPKDVPPIPQLLLKYEPSETINIFESSAKPKVEESSKPPVTAPYDPRVLRRDSRSSNSGSDTPPHLTIVDVASPTRESKPAPYMESVDALPTRESKPAPYMESVVASPTRDPKPAAPYMESVVASPTRDPKPAAPYMESVEEKKWLPPVLDKPAAPPVLEKNWLTSLKESETDSDSNVEPPVLERGNKSSPKFPPSPQVAEEFITIVKEEPAQVGAGDSPVVPPLIIKKIKPTPPASHLPRAIADPRMANLHHPRRPVPSKRTVERRRPAAEVVKSENTSTKTKSPESHKSEIEEILKEGKPKSAKTIPKKRRLSDKGEEKKKPAHRNRKSSMDYASPLDSCDAPESLSYSSYNQRPKRHPVVKEAPKKPSPFHEQSDTSSSIPDFGENSNHDCDSNSDINLKAKFKTIDPTASPFC